jgi:hypothetical protein
MRTSILLAALIAIGGAAPAWAAPDFFPASSEMYIAPIDLEELDCWGLWHARNEIYARNGFKFKTAEARAEFGDGGYTSNPKLNEYEQSNIALIQQYEASASC